jgi:hypothetical protein
MEFKSVKDLVVKDEDPTKHRHPGGPRKYIVRGEKAGRLLWFKVNPHKSSVGARLKEELTPTEQIVEELRSSDVYYDDLYPVVSSFHLVEESARLYKGDIDDWRYRKGVRVPFTDINNVGRSSSGVGRTLRRPFHGDGCNCYICMPEKD